MGAACQARSYASFIALLGDDDEVHLLPHRLYVDLARGAASAMAFAGRRMVLLDWHVSLDARSDPQEVVGETLTPVQFDSVGRVDWSAAVPPGCIPADADTQAPLACAPSASQRQRLHEALFAGSWPAGRTGDGSP